VKTFLQAAQRNRGDPAFVVEWLWQRSLPHAGQIFIFFVGMVLSKTAINA